MAFGLPVVALARGGVAEIIEHGRNGVLVQKASAQALARVAGRMLGDRELKERLSRAALETVTSRYSTDRMIDDTAHIFEELISNRTASQ